MTRFFHISTRLDPAKADSRITLTFKNMSLPMTVGDAKVVAAIFRDIATFGGKEGIVCDTGHRFEVNDRDGEINVIVRQKGSETGTVAHLSKQTALKLSRELMQACDDAGDNLLNVA